jgi:hypothetical protein
MLSALDASLNITPFWSDGDSVELIVIVLLIARVLSRLEPFKRTTKIIADSISTSATKMPSIVLRNGLICRNVGASTGDIGMSENGNTTACAFLR